MRNFLSVQISQDCEWVFFLTCWRLQFPLISIKTFSYHFLPRRLGAAWSVFWISNGCFPVREHLSGWAGWRGTEGGGLVPSFFVAVYSSRLELFLHSAGRVTLELRQVEEPWNQARCCFSQSGGWAQPEVFLLRYLCQPLFTSSWWGVWETSWVPVPSGWQGSFLCVFQVNWLLTSYSKKMI